MTKQIVLRAPASMVERRQPLLENADYSSRGGVRKVRLAEVAGGTTAECAAVCCCCPCGLVNLVVLAMYKVPARLCRKALRRKRRLRLMKQGLLPPHRNCGCEDHEFELHPVAGAAAVLNALEENNNNNNNSNVHNKEIVEVEKEMWEKFDGTGFWRSSSQRSEISI